jgi:F-type H+-transporting ATPase subunit b
MGKKILFLAGLIGVAFASEGGDMGTDFLPRTINFLIFVAILYYLLKDRIKEFFENRANSIEKNFQEIEEKLRRSKEQKEELEEELAIAKRKAQEIVETAKKERELIQNQILEQARAEVLAMEKSFEDNRIVELNRAKREVVESYLRKLLSQVHLKDSEALKLILKGNL